MGILITDRRDRIHINYGWAYFLMTHQVQCYNCEKDFGPQDDDLIFTTNRGVPDYLCGKCADKMALPHLE